MSSNDLLAPDLMQRLTRAVLNGLKPAFCLAVAAACNGSLEGEELGTETLEVTRAAAVLPVRAEVVAEADSLAVSGARKGGEAGARLTARAAALRERIWRRERREADALEAIELYRTASRAAWEGACTAEMDLALLEAELRADPDEAYKAIYLARARHPGHPCADRAQALLGVLSAYQPLPDVLAELDREAEDGSGARIVAASGGPTAVSYHVDPSGPIVVPGVSRAARAGPARITNLEHYGGEETARVVVFVTRPTLFDVGSLPGTPDRGPRLYVDIKDAKYQGASAYEVGGLVERVRVGRHETSTRVVLDLQKSVYRKVFYLPEPFRLVIDVSTEPPRSADRQAAAGPRAVRRVVLDPGHGGHDPGATGPSGLREKDVALDIAHRAAPLVARELGVSTLLTRDADVFVPLDERVARANAFGADLFVSIHCNASEEPLSTGIMTFVLDESGDDLAARIAARENAASPAAAAELANVMSRVLDADSIARSTHFAGLLQRAALSSVAPRYPDVADRGVRRAGFYVLAGARMPAVLFETSFISNGMEELRLNTGDYRQKMADAIVNAIRAYRDGA